MFPIWDIHQCHDFLHEGAPPRKSKLVKMFQDAREIRIWECPANFPYLNLIENACNFIKNNAQEKQPASITHLNEMLLLLLFATTRSVFKSVKGSVVEIAKRTN